MEDFPDFDLEKYIRKNFLWNQNYCSCEEPNHHNNYTDTLLDTLLDYNIVAYLFEEEVCVCGDLDIQKINAFIRDDVYNLNNVDSAVCNMVVKMMEDFPDFNRDCQTLTQRWVGDDVSNLDKVDCDVCAMVFKLMEEFSDDDLGTFIENYITNEIQPSCSSEEPTCCVCENGIPVLDSLCLVSGRNQCSSCDSGYRLEEDQCVKINCDPGYRLEGNECVPIPKVPTPIIGGDSNPYACRCPNGIADLDSLCSDNSRNQCSRCNPGFSLQGRQCVPYFIPLPPNVCTCANGSPVTDNLCSINGGNQCSSCNSGYRLKAGQCILKPVVKEVPPSTNDCTCTNGEPSTNCFQDDKESCASCSEYSALTAKTNGLFTCEPYVCQSNQFLNPQTGKCESVSSITTFSGQSLINKTWVDAYESSSSIQFLNLQNDLRIDFNSAVSGVTEFRLKKVSEDSTRRKKRQVQSGAGSITVIYDISVGAVGSAITDSIIAQLESHTSSLIISTSPMKITVAVSNINTDTLCAEIIENGVAGNTCDRAASDLVDTKNSLLQISKDIDSLSDQDKEKLIVQAANTMEDLQRSNDNNNALTDNEEDVASSQKEFETILLKSPANTAFQSRDKKLAVKTTNTIVNVNPITGKNEAIYNYESALDSGLKIVLPADNLSDKLRNDANNCPSPAVFSEMANSKHLKANDPDKEAISATSVLIETCDQAKGKVFSSPVTIQFKASKEIQANNKNRYGNNDSTKLSSAQTIDCAYYDQKYFKWKSSGKPKYDHDTDSYTCQADHLTYFSLLFKDDPEDNKALTAFDIFSNIFSVICCLLILIYCATSSGKLIWQKLGNKPQFRCYIQLAVSLLFINLTNLFGQQFYHPKNEEDCVAVAHILHWTILSFFLITLETALVMVAALYEKSFFSKNKSYIKVIFLIWPYLLSAIVVLTCMKVAKDYGDGYYYGGLESEKSYLKMVTLEVTGDVLCFVDGYFFDYGIILPYGLAMGTVIIAYIASMIGLYKHSPADQSKIDTARTNAKKLVLVFFSIGVCWLFLIISMSKNTSIAVDWIFSIFKAIQALVILWCVCAHKISQILKKLRGRFMNVSGEDSD